jgi:predicted tellurium resistance membrane protein TerC
LDWITNPEAWVALATLTIIEIVLGIDNVVFVSVLVQRLPPAGRDRARTIGLLLALGMRILLLFSLTWLAGLTAPLATFFGHAISARDVILLAGGLFLIWKATTEIGEALEGEPAHHAAPPPAELRTVLLQVVLLDAVFSLDSVLTAVGMANDIGVMVVAVVLAVAVMLLASGPISAFVHRHPTVKMLALAFLLLIGASLVAEGVGVHLDKAYIYAAMGFSVLVEALNLAARRRRAQRQEPVELRPTFVKDEPPVAR